MIFRSISWNFLIFGFACAATPESATLTVQLDRPGIGISQNTDHSSAPQETGIHLAGAPKPYASATALTLAGNDPLAGNTYAEPLKLSPVESAISLPANGTTDIKHRFPPYSVTLLRLQPVSQ